MKEQTDRDWLIIKGFYLDYYAFSERVGILLGDNAFNPKQDELENARNLAVMELQNE